MGKRLRSSIHNSAEDILSSAIKLTPKAAKPSLKALIWEIASSSELISTLPLALRQSVTQSINSFKQLPESNDSGNCTVSPPTSAVKKKLRKSSRQRKTNAAESDSDKDEDQDIASNIRNKRDFLVHSIEIYSHVAYLCISHPQKPFSPLDLLPSVQTLHDNLVLFESNSILQVEIAKLCEEWWKEQLPGRDTLISQSLPFLLSKSLTLGKKVDVHRVYALREAFSLFDFDDESIEDLKHLLLRCVIDPLFLKMEDGRRFVAFLFGLSTQLVKEILGLIRAQIPFGRKSVLEAYAEIIFRAWKIAEGPTRKEIEDGFLQNLVDGAIHARSDTLCASARRVLGGFVSQRTVSGVDKLLFRLTEPVIFRSLQVANSNVRKNALHMLLDVFPLEDPDSTKEVKDALFDRQFFLLERLLPDECPDVRVVAVEGFCRLLFLFWEIIPSFAISKTITKIVDDMSHDTCTEVRRSTLNGIGYLHRNPQTHEILKVLLPRLGHLLLDSVLSVRVAFIDLLLTLSDVHSFQFHKVVSLDALLDTLSSDQKIVAQKITRLLIPSYFPSNVSPEDACNRCITLIKRSPMAGARFCEFALTEGSSQSSLMELAKVSVDLVVSPIDLNPKQIEGLLVASVHLCNSLINEPSCKAALKELFSGKKLKQLFSAGATKHAQTAIFNIASIVLPDDVNHLIKECMVLIKNCGDLSLNVEMQVEIRPVHKLIISCGRFNEMIVALTELLQRAVSEYRNKFSTRSSEQSVPSRKGKIAKLNGSVKSKHVRGNKETTHDTSSFQQHYVLAAGAAWQLKDLLSSVYGRDAVFKCSKLEAMFSALELVSEISIEQCMHLEYMDTSPVLAYTAFALHAKPYKADLDRRNDIGNKTRKKSDSSSSLLKGNALENVLSHLFGCTKRLFTEGESSDLPRACDCSLADGGSCLCDKQCMLNMVKIVTEILKFIVDATTICPISDNHGKCLQFASACVQVIIPTLRKHFKGLLQLHEDLKGTLLCLKRSFTYEAKLLNVVLKKCGGSSPPPQEAFDLANNMFNLVMSIESCFGSQNASCLISAVKTWVLDVVLALGSPHLMTETPCDKDPSDGISHGTPCYLPWLRALGELELCEVRTLDQDEEDTTISPPYKFPVFKEVIEMVVQVVKRKPKVLDSVGVIFMSGVLTLLEREEYELAVGIIHFVCVKLVGEDGEWGDLQLMLGCLHEVYPRIKNIIEDSTNEEERQMLESAESLLESVWRNVCT